MSTTGEMRKGRERRTGLNGELLERSLELLVIGGGASDAGVFEACWAALRAGGRLVVNAVTLETEQRLAELFARHGGAMRRISLSRLEPVGGMHGWRAAMPVTQWVVAKP